MTFGQLLQEEIASRFGDLESGILGLADNLGTDPEVILDILEDDYTPDETDIEAIMDGLGVDDYETAEAMHTLGALDRGDIDETELYDDDEYDDEEEYLEAEELADTLNEASDLEEEYGEEDYDYDDSYDDSVGDYDTDYVESDTGTAYSMEDDSYGETGYYDGGLASFHQARIDELEDKIANFQYQSDIKDVLDSQIQKGLTLLENNQMYPVEFSLLFGSLPDSTEGDKLALFSESCDVNNVDPETQLYHIEGALRLFELRGEILPQGQFSAAAYEDNEITPEDMALDLEAANSVELYKEQGFFTDI